MRRSAGPERGSWLPLILLVACVGHLSGCGSLPQLGKPDESRPAAASIGTAEPHPEAPQTEQLYYAGRDDLRVYEQASSRSRLVGQLTLHQKVLRSAVSKGYARIRTPDGGLQGWVDNAGLIWRLPASEAERAEPSAQEAAPAPQAAETPQPETAAETAVGPEAGAPVEAAPGSVAPDETAAPAPPDDGATPEEGAEKPAPSVFNPF